MMKKLLVFLTMGLFSLSLVAGCDKKKEEGEGDKTEKKEEGKKEEGKKEEPKKEEPKKEEARGGGGGACDAYAKCCNAYAEALGGVKNVPKSAVEATKKACGQIENLKKMPNADATCKKAMEAMKKAGAAYKSMPGFKWPDACK